MADFIDKAMGLAGEALDKTGEMVEIGKLKAKIATKKNDIEKYEKQIGLYMYDLYKDNDGSFELNEDEESSHDLSVIRDICRQIDGAYDEIALLESKIDRFKE